ncbi:MAG: hypothetical protein C0600_08620 [Ignavibacteria bacterium]|nr:MAG: hypothetical protein C0600_08620 [Ignavibacteria bacterium]
MKTLGAALVLLLCALNLQAQDKETTLVISSCDGNVEISDNAIKVRGYTFYPVACVDGSMICFKTEDGRAEAVLNLGKRDCIHLTVIEDGMEMEMKCCWKEIRRGDKPMYETVKSDTQRRAYIAQAIHSELGTINMVSPMKRGM